jgi:hypothetical protein
MSTDDTPYDSGHPFGGPLEWAWRVGVLLAMCFGPAAAAIATARPGLFLVNAFTAPMGLGLLFLWITEPPTLPGHSPR